MPDRLCLQFTEVTFQHGNELHPPLGSILKNLGNRISCIPDTDCLSIRNHLIDQMRFEESGQPAPSLSVSSRTNDVPLDVDHIQENSNRMWRSRSFAVKKQKWVVKLRNSISSMAEAMNVIEQFFDPYNWTLCTWLTFISRFWLNCEHYSCSAISELYLLIPA